MTTYYCDWAVGNDGNLGTSEGVGNAWKTIDKAMNTVVAGDTVYVKASGAYAETATIDTAGTNLLPIVFEGYTSTPGDGGQATVTGSAVRTNCIADSLVAPQAYYVFKNFICTAAAGRGVQISVLSTFWKNCSFSGNVSYGFQGGQVLFEGCKFNDNGGGIEANANSVAFIGCQFFRNGAYGIKHDGAANSSCVVLFSEFFSNVSSAIYSLTFNDKLIVVVGCTIDGDVKDTDNGLWMATGLRYLSMVANNIFYDCTTGITSPNQGQAAVSRNNLVNANTAPYSGYATFTGEVTAAPQFTGEGIQDYTLGAASPARNVGFDRSSVGMDIGAHQSTDAGGGDYPVEGDVRNGVDYNTGALTGTLIVPAESNVRDGVVFDDGVIEGDLVIPVVGDVEAGVGFGNNGTEYTGTFVVPLEGDVELAVGYGKDGTEFTGTLVPGGGGDFPAEVDVRAGVDYDLGALTGTLVVPAVGDVRDNTIFDATSEGVLNLPVVGDVEAGVSYDNATKTGTFAKPAVGEVKATVGYGAGGVEFTGTRTVPVVGNVATGSQYGAGGTGFTGTLTVPAVGDVQTGVTYGAGGTERTGTFAVPAESDVENGVDYGAGGTEFEGSLLAEAPSPLLLL